MGYDKTLSPEALREEARDLRRIADAPPAGDDPEWFRGMASRLEGCADRIDQLEKDKRRHEREHFSTPWDRYVERWGTELLARLPVEAPLEEKSRAIGEAAMLADRAIEARAARRPR